MFEDDSIYFIDINSILKHSAAILFDISLILNYFNKQFRLIYPFLPTGIIILKTSILFLLS